MNKKIKLAILAAVLIAAVYFAYTYFYKSNETVIELETVKVKEGEVINSVTATGTIEPIDQVEVGTQVSGTVERIYVDYNSEVKKGQLIAELDKTNLRASVEDARASYNSALNELNYYQQNFNRQQNMYNAKVISKSEYEQATYQLNNAKTVVSQRKSNLSQAQTNLGYANIYSPIDGVVLTKEVEEGQTVQASMSTPTLFTIAKDLTKMQVEANVDEADIGNVKEGQRVSFTVDAYPDEDFSGKVTQVRLGATTTSNVVTYTVVVDADNTDLKLKPGLTATINIYTQELKDINTIEAKALNFTPDEALLLKYYEQNQLTPQEMAAVTNSGKTKYVWIKDSTGYINPKKIEVGVSDGVNVEIVSGLSEGDEVIYSLKESKASEVVEAAAESPFMPKRPGKK